MSRSTKIRSTTMLLLSIALLHPTQAWDWPSNWMNTQGPGSHSDVSNGRSGHRGGPNKGYHVRTEDASKAWNGKVTCLPLDKNGSVKQNGTPVSDYNQRIVKDAEADTFYLYVDPADKVAPDSGYSWNSSGSGLFDTPKGQNNAGYPHTAIQDSITSVLKLDASTSKGAGSANALHVQKRGADAQPKCYAAVAEENDYTLIFFGAKWCVRCQEFTPRFKKWYDNEKKTGSKKFEVVFVSDDLPADFAKNFGDMSYKAVSVDGKQDEHLALRLQTLLKQKNIPYVAVIDKKGELVQCDAIKGMEGKDSSFPLGAAPQFFQDEPILPNGDDCSTDEAAQREELKQWAEQAVREMTEQRVKEFAQRHKIDLSAVPAGGLKDYVIQELKKMIDGAKGDKLTELYASLNDPSNYRFKKNDYVRVVACEGEDVCPVSGGSFMSDAELSQMPQKVPVYSNDNKRNVGVILSIQESDGAIGVRFRDNPYTPMYIKPEHFKFIEQISKKMYDNPDTRSTTQ